MPISETERQEAEYHRRFRDNPLVLRLKRAMDEWCAVWFWPMDEEGAQLAPRPVTFHAAQADRDRILDALVHDLRFFHWELEFPDVFTPERAGFDAVLGNPPWEVMKPNSQEFFTAYDPLYRTYDKQAALAQQRELFAADPAIRTRWDNYIATFKSLSNWVKNAADPFTMSLALGGRGEDLKGAWERARQYRVGYANREQPYRYQGSADMNSYKLFAEFFWFLLRTGGRIGVILPTGIYSDYGTRDFRDMLFTRGRLEFLYAFQNEKRVFEAAHHSFKQVSLISWKGGNTDSFLTRFRMGVGDSPEAHEIPDDLLLRDELAMRFTPEDVEGNSPKSLSLVELRTPRDLDIFRTIYANSIRIGDKAPGWEITYACEFHMTNDSKHFPPLEKWEAKGYKPDVFGRWIGPTGEVALPFYEGRMIGQFDFLTMSWVSGQGSASVWADLPFDAKCYRTKALIGDEDARTVGNGHFGPKVLFRDIARNTDTRTMIAAVVPAAPCGHTISTLRMQNDRLDKVLFVSAALNSFCFDNVLRSRSTGTHQSWFILEECPFPRVTPDDFRFHRLVFTTAGLTFLHRRFARSGCDCVNFIPTWRSGEWKHWWAVTEADRLRFRVEIGALVADLYGLTPDDFDWIVRDDPTDPKGFYRVDRTLPFRERLTGLAAAAFHALKAGKWDATRAAAMSNDEFFAAIGIPEMTAGPNPLIRKRDGCRRWHPEEFGPDDPRHGWTWDHCRQDAIALLGSEEAVRKYVEGVQAEKEAEKASGGPTDLFGQPLPPKQRKLF